MDKIGIVVVLLLISPAFVDAEILVTQIMYDPDGVDTGLEWVELHNTLDVPVRLEGYSLWTGDGSTENDWVLEWTGVSETIPAHGFFLIGEDLIPADVMTALDLQNGPDAVRLQKDSVTFGTVGWGVHTFPEYYETAPAPLSGSGMALARIGTMDGGVYSFQDTGDNSQDFVIAQPSPRNSSTATQSGGIEIILQVDEARPDISGITLDDDLNGSGFQILPMPGANRSVGVSAIVSYSLGVDALSVDVSWQHGTAVLEAEGEGSSSVFSGTFSVPFDAEPQDYQLLVTASIAGDQVAQGAAVFTVLPVTGLEIDTDRLFFANLTKGQMVSVQGDASMVTRDRPTLRNIGNRPLDLSVRATPFQGIGALLDLSTLSCRVGESDIFQVRETPVTVGVGLGSGETMPFSLEYTVPLAAGSGTYKGSILIGAVSG